MPRKLSYSNYLLTINTQKAFYTGDEPEFEPLKQQLTDAINAIAGDGETLFKYVEFKTEDSWEENVQAIENVNVQSSIEIGEAQNRLHAHVLVSFRHRTRMKLDYKGINKTVKEVLPNSHVYANWFPNSTQILEEYINKWKEMDKFKSQRDTV